MNTVGMLVRLTRDLSFESKLAGCRSCGLVFSGVTTFDQHRDQGKGKERACRDPRTLGMVENEYKVWGRPTPEGERPAHWGRRPAKRERV